MTNQIERATAVLSRVRPLGRLDRKVGLAELSHELQVSPEAFKTAAERLELRNSGEHYWFGLRSLKTAIAAHEREIAREEIAARKAELELLLAKQGKRLSDLVKVRKVRTTKLSGVLTIRITEDEAQDLEYPLNLTGEPNVSAQVKACVRAYPELREIRTSYVTLKKELEELKDAVNSIPALLIHITEAIHEAKK
ncbi:hypothetical protein [Variovorax sp. W2I14]|uniref:hypothetical protein n=1 Tax=Variovorax sp. W2I14 TaxID=3042290 RepID=UPI003D1C3BAE